MQIPSILTIQTSTDSQTRSQQWQTGQRLQALVIDPGAADRTARIQIGGRELTLQSAIPRAAGQRITLEVLQGGERPELRLVNSTTANPSPQHALLARLLPSQGSQVPMLALLAAAQQSGRLQAGLPPSIQESIAAVLRQIPSLAQVTEPQALREALRQSGLLHEALMATALTTGTRPPPNLKSALLSLALRLRQTSETRTSPTNPENHSRVAPPRGEVPPPQTRDLPIPQPRVSLDLSMLSAEQVLKALGPRTEQALSRLILHQLNSAPTSDLNHLRWLLELPIQTSAGIDLLHLRIEQDRNRRAAQQARAWSVELALDLPELGAVYARITVRENHLSAHLWLSNEKTQQAFEKALPDLRKALEHRGLQIGELGCQHGDPPQTSAYSAQPQAGSSLDLRA
jgi:hypothetical protein